MTIASEITRLQWAKSDARTSIINKGVSVPESAKVDTYHSYIDQIQQWDWGILSSWIKLYPYLIYSSTYRGVNIWWFYSRFDWTTYYGLNAIYTYWNSHDEHCYWICTYKKTANSDITYSNSFSDLYWAYHSSFDNVIFYKKWNEVRCYIVTGNDAYPREYGSYVWRWYTWDYINNTITGAWGWMSNSTNPEDWWIDLTWRTLVSWSYRVESVTWWYNSPDWYIYLTLK